MTTQSVTLMVPLPVQRTSYRNAKDISMPPMLLPLIHGAAPYSARAYADFEQNGTLSYFVHDVDYTDANRTLGHVHLFRIESDRSMTDITASMVVGDTTGCLHARKAVVADFNGDGKPDVFVACHGYDGVNRLPLEGEFPYILMSRPDGRYSLQQVVFGDPTQTPYLHGAAAIDVNGDGYASIVVADHNATNRCESPLYVLRNNRDGTFTKDASNFPQFADCNSPAAGSVEILDLLGNATVYLYAAGFDSPYPTTTVGQGLQPMAFAMTGDMVFEANPSIIFPTYAPQWSPLDIVVRNGYAYFNRVSSDADVAGPTGGYVVQQVDLSSCSSTPCSVAQIVYTANVDYSLAASTNPTCVGYGGHWVDWIRFDGDQLVTDDLCRSPNKTIP